MVLVHRNHAPFFQASGDDKEQPLDALLDQDRQHVGVMILQPIVESEQAQITLWYVLPTQESERRFQRCHLVTFAERGYLVPEVICKHALDAWKARSGQVADVMIHNNVQSHDLSSLMP